MRSLFSLVFFAAVPRVRPVKGFHLTPYFNAAPALLPNVPIRHGPSRQIHALGDARVSKRAPLVGSSSSVYCRIICTSRHGTTRTREGHAMRSWTESNGVALFSNKRE